MSRRLAVLIFLLASLPPANASAEWLISPFVAMKFGGATCPCPAVVVELADPEGAAGLRKFTFGGAAGFLTDGVLGVEMDFAFIPSYLDRESALNTVVGSSMLMLTGEVIIAVPASITRDGLRPYLVGGIGLMRESTETVENVFDKTRNLLGLTVGAGAIGRLTDRTSLRFELRHLSDLNGEPSELPLRFWRASIGITLRY